MLPAIVSRFIRPLLSSGPEQTDGLDGLMRGEGDAPVFRAERESAWRETLLAAVEGVGSVRFGDFRDGVNGGGVGWLCKEGTLRRRRQASSA